MGTLQRRTDHDGLPPARLLRWTRHLQRRSTVRVSVVATTTQPGVNHLNFHVITGASGGGKSTLIRALAARGCYVVPEIALGVMQEQEQQGGRLVPKENLQGFMDEVFQRSLSAYDAARSLPGPVFFDRALPECLAHMRLLGLTAGPAHEMALERRRYAHTVFVTPPWQEIYVRDRWRQADFTRASRSFEATVGAYTDAGYVTCTIPQVSVEERTAFVLGKISAG